MQTSEQTKSVVSNPVVDAIRRGTVGDLKTEDVLASLDALGIRSLNELAARMLEKLRSADKSGKNGASQVSLQMLRQQPPDGLDAAIEHPVPQVPFRWNDTEHDPADIRRFNGQAIAYIPTTTQSGDIQLSILDDMQLVRSWLDSRCVNWLMSSAAKGRTASCSNGDRASGLQRGAREFPASMQAGEHVLTGVIGPEDPPGLWVGEILEIHPGQYYPDLTQVWLNWPWTRWNDQISFIGSSRSYCAFWDHIHSQGDVLLAGANIGGDWIPFLTTIGWNDRISSCANYGS
jgi:hypothetical protein